MACDADSVKHLSRKIKDFCCTNCGWQSDVFLSISDSVHLLVEFLLKGKVSALQCVFAFGTELVDLIETVKERLLSVCKKLFLLNRKLKILCVL